MMAASPKDQSASKDQAKPAVALTKKESANAVTLPTDSTIARRLEVARDDLQKSETRRNAIGALQSILDLKNDVFVGTTAKDTPDSEKRHWVSARAEADRLLGTLPAKGRALYESQYGAAAKKLLADAKNDLTLTRLEEVVERYFHTAAGAEAADLLGRRYLEDNRPLLAALCYERLLGSEHADQLSNLTLFKAALAFRRAAGFGFTKRADETWNRLAAKVGKENGTLEQLRNELDRAHPWKAGDFWDWPLFRGDARRSGEGRGGVPSLENKWRKSNLDLNLPPGEQLKLNPATREWVETAIRRQMLKPQPMIPAFTPIAVADKLVYRSFWGIHCVDVKTGELLWDSTTTAGLDSLVRDLERKQDVQVWFDLYKRGLNQNIIFENSVIGTLSTDNARVYAVDDLALPPHPNGPQGNPGTWNGMSFAISLLTKRSRLEAINLETGKLDWEHGDPSTTTRSWPRPTSWARRCRWLIGSTF
jgi:hypothetical protein